MNLSTLNWLAILVAALASFALGFLWYGPLFGKKWQQEVKLSDDEMKNANMPKIFGLSFVLTFIAALTLALMTPENAVGGMKLGATLGIGLVATATGTNYLFARKSNALWLMDAGYQVVLLIVMGAIIGAWH